MTTFAIRADVDLARLTRWRHNGPVWVPGADVHLGERKLPGWSAECTDWYWPWMPPYERPEPVAYLDTTQMCARLHMTYEVLWACIADDKTLPEPAIWVDDNPGWPVPPQPSKEDDGRSPERQ
ncbi:hypothetical protein ACIBCN_44290 [Nocardia sp. NPDC051052]|uniref:hypothetical protein n=1 Tax=Nocardia sp. NPDC051052 TaxID=3364322 RepID=UPI0037BB817A